MVGKLFTSCHRCRGCLWWLFRLRYLQVDHHRAYIFCDLFQSTWNSNSRDSSHSIDIRGLGFHSFIHSIPPLPIYITFTQAQPPNLLTSRNCDVFTYTSVKKSDELAGTCTYPTGLNCPISFAPVEFRPLHPNHVVAFRVLGSKCHVDCQSPVGVEVGSSFVGVGGVDASPATGSGTRVQLPPALMTPFNRRSSPWSMTWIPADEAGEGEGEDDVDDDTGNGDASSCSGIEVSAFAAAIPPGPPGAHQLEFAMTSFNLASMPSIM